MASTLFDDTTYVLSFDHNQFVRYGKMHLRKRKLSALLPAALLKDPCPEVWLIEEVIFDANEEVSDLPFCQEYKLFLNNMYHQLKEFGTNQESEGLFAYLDSEAYDTLCSWGGWRFEWALGLAQKKVLAYLLLSGKGLPEKP